MLRTRLVWFGLGFTATAAAISQLVWRDLWVDRYALSSEVQTSNLPRSLKFWLIALYWFELILSADEAEVRFAGSESVEPRIRPAVRIPDGSGGSLTTLSNETSTVNSFPTCDVFVRFCGNFQFWRLSRFQFREWERNRRISFSLMKFIFLSQVEGWSSDSVIDVISGEPARLFVFPDGNKNYTFVGIFCCYLSLSVTMLMSMNESSSSNFRCVNPFHQDTVPENISCRYNKCNCFLEDQSYWILRFCCIFGYMGILCMA